MSTLIECPHFSSGFIISSTGVRDWGSSKGILTCGHKRYTHTHTHTHTVWYEPTCVDKSVKPFLANCHSKITYTSPNLSELRNMYNTLTNKPTNAALSTGMINTILTYLWMHLV